MRNQTLALAFAAALASTATVAQTAPNQGSSTPTPGVSADETARQTFCNDAEALYREILMTQPGGLEKPSATSSVTYSAYRQGATQRVMSLIVSARCNLQPFLNMERDYLIKSMRPNKPYQPYGAAVQAPTGSALSPIQNRR